MTGDGYSNRLERAVLFLPGDVLRNRCVATLLRILAGDCPNDDQPLRIGYGQITQHERPGDAQDRGVAADTQRQGNCGDRGETGVLTHQAQPVTDVLPEIVKPRDATLIA